MIHEGKDDEAELSANALKAFNTSITHFLKQKTGYFDEINKNERRLNTSCNCEKFVKV